MARLGATADSLALDAVYTALRPLRAHRKSRDVNAAFVHVYSRLLHSYAEDAFVGALYRALRSISMLEVWPLLGLTAQAILARGPIIEIGAYVGSASAALAIGAKIAGVKVVSVDKGGAHLEHHAIPTADICADWRANIEALRLADTATLIEDNYGCQSVRDRLATMVGARKAGGLVVDADGYADRAISIVAPFLKSPARLTVDDYAGAHNEKTDATTRAVNRLSQEGVCRNAAVLGHGTWFGEMDNFEELASERAMVVLLEQAFDAPGAWRFVLPPTRDFLRISDEVGQEYRSSLLLLEDGRMIGQPHLEHAVMKAGTVGFSHWRDHLYFLLDGGRDPRETACTYEIVVSKNRFKLLFA